MDFDLLVENELIFQFERAYNKKEPLSNPIIYNKGTVCKEKYEKVFENKGDFCYINTIGGPSSTKWYLYHCNDNKFIFINRIVNYCGFCSSYEWFYCSSINLQFLSINNINKNTDTYTDNIQTPLSEFNYSDIFTDSDYCIDVDIDFDILYPSYNKIYLLPSIFYYIYKL